MLDVFREWWLWPGNIGPDPLQFQGLSGLIRFFRKRLPQILVSVVGRTLLASACLIPVAKDAIKGRGCAQTQPRQILPNVNKFHHKTHRVRLRTTERSTVEGGTVGGRV